MVREPSGAIAHASASASRLCAAHPVPEVGSKMCISYVEVPWLRARPASFVYADFNI